MSERLPAAEATLPTRSALSSALVSPIRVSEPTRR